MKAFTTIVLLALISLSCGAPKKLPSYLRFCKRSDPNFDDCTLRLLNSIQPNVAKGVPQIHSPSLDPFVIPALQLNRDTDNLQLRANLKNLQAYGASQYQVTKLRTDIKNNAVEVSVLLPLLKVTTEYDVKGRVLVIPLNGKGIFKADITNVQADIKMTGKVIEKRGKKYLEVTNVSSKVKVGNVKVDPSTGNPRNDLITQSAMDFWENNKRQVLDVIAPVTDETTDAIVQQVANRILATLPYDTILPP
ncbi:protein takeout-like [Ischnura elegans]|uniref:protein takeout-like n=1 Tax=Ischnura elegans TaxID=197161 RepID=UPI001ED8AA1E|nr:protein takeout-like [Ischnura elegans]